MYVQFLCVRSKISHFFIHAAQVCKSKQRFRDAGMHYFEARKDTVCLLVLADTEYPSIKVSRAEVAWPSTYGPNQGQQAHGLAELFRLAWDPNKQVSIS